MSKLTKVDPNLNLKTFESIDASDSSEAYINALITFDAIEQMQVLKKIAIQKMQLQTGMRVLDAGCGIGLETSRLAKLVAPHGKVTGVDISATFLKKATELAKHENQFIEFQQADISSLPFPSNYFDAVRAERVLLYLNSPLNAIKELLRVSKPGACICLIEPDWETNTINIEDRSLVRKILHYDCDNNIKNGWIGRTLPELLKKAHVTHYDLETRIITLPRSLSSQFYLGMAQSAYEANIITGGELETWQQAITQLVSKNQLFCTISYFLYSFNRCSN